MDVLLHICCGPCLIYPFKRLAEERIKVKGFYYNPNIHPAEEYQRRKASLAVLSQELALDVVAPEYDQREFFQGIASQEDAPQRCAVCWSLRLEKTARHAKENGISHFGTTLLVSPYQDHAALKQIGEKISRQSGVGFYYEDFRPGFKTAYNQARLKGLYLQKYCGCIYSMRGQTCQANAK